MQQLEVLRRGLEAWGEWRRGHPGARIDLSGIDLRDVDLSLKPALLTLIDQGRLSANISLAFIANEVVGYELAPWNLSDADLTLSNLSGSNLECIDLRRANLAGTSLQAAALGRSNLAGARLVGTDLRGANLRATDLSQCTFIRTQLEGCDLGYARVYGIAVWDVDGTPKDESNLTVTPDDAVARLSADSLAFAQFLYAIIQNPNVRNAIDQLTTRVVLVLGNFSADRKPVLDEIRVRLRELGFAPIVFDFAVPDSKDTTGTVETLARLSRFIVADLTAPSSVPHELATIVPFLRTTPVLLLRRVDATGYSMVKDLKAYPWVLDIHEYESEQSLYEQLRDVIRPADELAGRLRSSERP